MGATNSCTTDGRKEQAAFQKPSGKCTCTESLGLRKFISSSLAAVEQLLLPTAEGFRDICENSALFCERSNRTIYLCTVAVK